MGTTQVNAGSDLTADHIIQSALVIGGAAMNNASVTIDASDASGNPLGEVLSSGIAGSLASEDGSSNSGMTPLGAKGFNGDPLPTSGTPNSVGTSPVPEPETILLAALACLGSLPHVVRRRLR